MPDQAAGALRCRGSAKVSTSQLRLQNVASVPVGKGRAHGLCPLPPPAARRPRSTARVSTSPTEATILRMSRTLLVDLSDEDDALLSTEARGGGVDPEELARSLLHAGLQSLRVDPAALARELDEDPGAFDAIQRSREQGRRGETIPLSEL